MNTFEKLIIEKNELEQRLLKLNQVNDQEEEIRDSVNLIQDHLLKFERGFNKSKSSMKKRLIQNLLKQG